MTRPKNIAAKPTGRPRLPDLEKPCARCGRLFSIRDGKFQSRSRFMQRKYCSRSCAGNIDNATEEQVAQRFWAQVAKGSPDECWAWTGKLTVKGYGRFEWKGKQVRAHRFALSTAIGGIPDGLMALHSCDNRACCNPGHLRAGTAKDNVADAIERGRFPQGFRSKGN